MIYGLKFVARAVIGFLIVCLPVLPSSAQVKKPVKVQAKTLPQRYTVAFYNIENFFDTLDNPSKQDEEFTPLGAAKYTSAVYKEKLKNIARVIADLGKDKDADGVDIIGLAEVENDRVLKDLLAQPALKKRNYKYIIFDGHDQRGINVALVYNPAHYKVLKSRPLFVPLSEGTRDVLYVSGLMAKDTVHLLVNHWPSRREGQQQTKPLRMMAAAVNKNIVDSLLNKNDNSKILLLGDFNDNPNNTSILSGLHAGGKNEELTLFNPWLDVYRSGKGSLQYKKQWDLFDQIILSPGFLAQSKLQFNEAVVFNRDYLITQNGKFKGQLHRSFAGPRWIHGYSDHLPVILYLKTPNK